MPRDLFGNVTRPSISIGNRNWYTLPVSLFSHSALVAMIVALPLLAPAVMPSVFADGDLAIITELVPPTPPLPPRHKSVEVLDHPPTAPGVPTQAPIGVSPEKPAPESGWEYSRTPGGMILGEIDTKALAPPPVAGPPPSPIRVGGAVRAPQKLREINPVYPAIAQAARIQGIVIIEATIGADGRVVDARVLRSVPMLDPAALEAVRQWEYTPTMLNGVPVAVIMTVTVSFTLSR